MPERAPNFQPPTLADDLVSNENGDLVSTSVLSVRFRIDASRSARQEAIDLVDGTVIGGLNPGTDGLYYVQVEGDGSIERIYEIAIALYRLPQVELASPYTVFSGQ